MMRPKRHDRVEIRVGRYNTIRRGTVMYQVTDEEFARGIREEIGSWAVFCDEAVTDGHYTHVQFRFPADMERIARKDDPAFHTLVSNLHEKVREWGAPAMQRALAAAEKVAANEDAGYRDPEALRKAARAA